MVVTRRRARNVKATARRVRFSNAPPAVHAVPRNGGRGLEPGYEARKKRRRALRLHRIATPLKFVDRDWGENGFAGKRGRYSEWQARQNLWHDARYGEPLYVLTRPKGRPFFAERYADEKHRQRLREYDVVRKIETRLNAKPKRRLRPVPRR